MLISTAMCRRLGVEQYAQWVCEQNGIEFTEECPTTCHADIVEWLRARLDVPEEPVVEEEAVVEQPVEEVTEEAPADDTPFPSALAYDSMTVVELRELCKERGLPVYGTKAEIILRLRQADNGIEIQEDEAEGPAEEEAAPEVESDAPVEETAATNEDDVNDTSGDQQEPADEEQ